LSSSSSRRGSKGSCKFLLLLRYFTTGYGFNPGSALLLNTDQTGVVGSLAAVNTTLAAACGGVTALFTNLYLEERKTGDYSFNLTMAMNGLLGGLVAITAGAGFVEPWAACFIGMVAGWVYLFGSSLLLRWKIDDAVDAVPVHLFNGIWGLISTGLLTSPNRMLTALGTKEHIGFFYSLGQGSVDFQLLCNQFVAMLFLIGWPIGTMTPFFIWLNYMGWLRADSLEELVGLDLSYHGGSYDQKYDTDDVPEEDMKSFLARRGQTLTRSDSEDFGDYEDDN
jgi:Amt family ammonium transporter